MTSGLVARANYSSHVIVTNAMGSIIQLYLLEIPTDFIFHIVNVDGGVNTCL